ncbi:MAG: hypothetical protein HQM10_19620 [Candidatus Riflebacteria bacterium]|nr:hypothetical protein [Candidatus Riflebacteria bacterium]
MLLIRCSVCKNKLWKYNKIGNGEVLICHKDRITRIYEITNSEGRVSCTCGNEIGIDKGDFIKMIAKGFVYSGTKSSR